MNDYAEQAEADRVDVDQARGELERLLADARFKVTDRNRAFLRYIAEEHFAGRSKGVKAYSIAVDVFGRSTDFNANIDPIVRIEATRLRASLEQYYEAHGAELPIHIHLPRGHYVAEFTRTQAPMPSETGGDTIKQDGLTGGSGADVPPQLAERPRVLDNISKIAIGFVLAIALMLTANYFASLGEQSNRTSLKPLVRLSLVARDPADKAEAERLEDELLVSLTRFGTLRLSSISDYNDDVDVETVGSIAISPRSREGDYDLILKYEAGTNFSSVSWRIVEKATGQTLSSGEERAPRVAAAENKNFGLLLALGQHFGAPAGELNTLELARAQGSSLEGNACVLASERAVSLLDRAKLDEAIRCLEDALIRDATDPDTKAALSRALVVRDYFVGSTANAVRALQLADQAVAALPSSDRAHIARVSALFANGRREDAFAAGREAIKKNPYNKDLASMLALRLFVAGYAQEGVDLIMRTGLIDGAQPRNALHVLAMAEYSRGNPEKTVQLLRDVPSDERLGEATRIAALVRLNKREDAASALAKVLDRNPQFSRDLERLLSVSYFNRHLRDMLRADLATAGRWRFESLRWGHKT